MKSDEVDVFTAAVLSNLQKIENTEETGGNRQRRSDVWETDGLDGIDLDLAVLVHRVRAANLDVRAHPYPHADSDFAAANSFS